MVGEQEWTATWVRVGHSTVNTIIGTHSTLIASALRFISGLQSLERSDSCQLDHGESSSAGWQLAEPACSQFLFSLQRSKSFKRRERTLTTTDAATGSTAGLSSATVPRERCASAAHFG